MQIKFAAVGESPLLFLSLVPANLSNNHAPLVLFRVKYFLPGQNDQIELLWISQFMAYNPGHQDNLTSSPELF